MKSGSLAALVALVGCVTWISACDSDSGPPASPGPDASTGGNDGSGGKASGGAAGSATGGSMSGGAAGAGGGSGGKMVAEAGPPDASPESGIEPPPPDGGAPDGGDAGANCANFRCVGTYPEVLHPAQNPGSDDKAMLGKFLFWDEQMGSLDNMACGTCHRSFSGGSDPRTNAPIAHLAGPDGTIDSAPGPTSDDIRGAAGVRLCSTPSNVTGANPQVTLRKPPSYFDAMFANRVFWDGRAGDCKPGDGNSGGCFYDPDTIALNPAAKPLITGTFDTTTGRVVGGALEQQAMGPPISFAEMACADQTWAKIEQKLATATPLAKAKPGFIPRDMLDFADTYPKMFAKAFGSTAKLNNSQPDDVINSQRIAYAIATHERRLTSNQTPWDKWRAGDDSALTAQQLRGYVAFMTTGRCNVCHAPPLFTDNSFHNIGFHKPAWDQGRGKITNVAAENASFKTPTLRNVGLREQFGLLHEGEGPGHDLPTVMALYKQGGQRTDPDIGPFIDSQLLAVPLTQTEIDDIIEFLRNALTDPRVKAEQAPFDRPHLSTE
jgi:cytochrome c peroxidase